MKRTSTITVVIIAIVVAAITTQTGVAQSSGGGRLAGTWEVVVTPRNCDTGNAITSFQSTSSFNQGGTYSGITAGTAPSARTSEVGVWAHGKADTYKFRFKAYLFNASGVATGYQVVTHQLQLAEDGNSWASEGIFQAFNMTGTQVGSGCATAEGTRLTLE